jgi:hypothetical protein
MREAYHFRATNWLLDAGPDNHRGPGMQRAILRQNVLSYPKFCFHASETTNHQGILARGCTR